MRGPWHWGASWGIHTSQNTHKHTHLNMLTQHSYALSVTHILTLSYCTHSHWPGLFLLYGTKVFPAHLHLPASPGPKSPSPSCPPPNPKQTPPTVLTQPALEDCSSSKFPGARTGEGATRVSYLEGREVGVAHDPVDCLEVG
jgi:hypothetical protein